VINKVENENEIVFAECSGYLWTPVRTKPRQEKKLKEYCRSKKIECYLPLLKKAHKYGKRTTTFTVPMFPGYVFCHIDEELYRDLVLSHAVLFKVNVNEHNEGQLLLELRAIQTMERLCGMQEIEIKPELVKGVQVEVVSGPLQGTCGVVKTRKNRTMLTVNIEILGHSASVEINAEDVDAVK